MKKTEPETMAAMLKDVGRLMLKGMNQKESCQIVSKANGFSLDHLQRMLPPNQLELKPETHDVMTVDYGLEYVPKRRFRTCDIIRKDGELYIRIGK